MKIISHSIGTRITKCIETQGDQNFSSNVMEIVSL